MEQEKRIVRHPFGITMDALTTEAFIRRVIGWAKESSRIHLITYLNAHCINLYFKDAQYAQIVDAADCVYADGQAVIWASRFLRQSLPERVNAGDFFPQFCALCAREHLPIYLLGSYPGVAEKASMKLLKNVSGLQVSGYHSGFFKPEEEPILVRKIREARPAILLIGMGVPRQEQFAAAHRAEWGVPVVWCVGALFEYYAGRTTRAPVWMRRLGLEWLFRLIMEPRRMGKRYVLGNIAFLAKIMKFKFQKKPPFSH